MRQRALRTCNSSQNLLIWLIASLVGATALSAETPALVTLASPGNPPSIVAPTAMEDQVRYAVDDLRHYLQRITGMKVERSHNGVAGRFGIYVGDVADNKDLKPFIEKEQLGRDGFVLDISPRGIRILGGGKFGTAYGVYELLERLGVRWLFPGEWGEVVPSSSAISLPAGRSTHKPSFLIRRMAVNYFYDPRLYRYDPKLFPQLSADAAADYRAASNSIGDWKRRNRHNTSGYFGHSNLIPPTTYGDRHPEWFAEIDGKRRLDPHNWKLCHSNEQMVQQAVRDTLAEIRKRKADLVEKIDDGYKHLPADYFIISVGPTDGGGFCRCPACLKMGSVSDRLQHFANEIAAEVRKEFPDYWVGYYGAYSEAQDPPTVKAQPGVIVFLTTYTRGFFHDLMATANRGFREKLEAWMPACPDRAMADFDGIPDWWGLGPLSYVELHQVDYPWYARHGIRGVSTKATIGWAATGYSSYVTGKLWWNPDANIQALRRDFVTSAYAEAFEPMLRYHERLDEARVYPSPETRSAMRTELEAAARIAQRPDVKRRIDYIRAYYVLWDAFTHFQAGTVTTEELRSALRLAKSVDYSVSPLRPLVLQRLPGAPATAPGAYEPEELNEFLNGVVLTKPEEEAVTWLDDKDIRLVPLSTAAEKFSTDMGANFRYGPTTVLIHARSNERLVVSQEGGFTRTEYELFGPEQTLMEGGASEKRSIVDTLATTEGIYTLVLYTGASMPRIHVSNRWAAVKAAGALQTVQPYGKSTFYFYVPKGSRQFVMVTRPQGELTMEVWGPYDAERTIAAPTTQKSRIFEEHKVLVPPGTDGTIWRVRFTGQTNMVYLKGIPPFLAGDPNRVLVSPER